LCKDKNLKAKLNLKKYRFTTFLFFTIFLLNIRCNNINNKETKVNSIEVKVKVDRFDEVFDTLSESNISNIKKKYPFLFPSNYSNTFWLNKSNDTLYNLLKKAVTNKFKDFNDIEDNMSHFYKHLKYEFPQVKVPRIISVINNVDYENKLILADTLLIISIDSYLGANHSLYDGIPLFVKNGMDINYLLSNIAEKYANKIIIKHSERNFLSKMIFYGKQLYFKDIIMMHSSDAVKINYSEEENTWVNKNELFIWQYIIEKQLLYDTDDRLDDRFLLPAPFSKFYLEIDNDSPGRIGQWIGWQIVRSYSDEFPDAELYEILDLPAEELFNKSKYKPRRIWQ
jgi:gliding motility-associated lipoprotein GldB